MDYLLTEKSFIPEDQQHYKPNIKTDGVDDFWFPLKERRQLKFKLLDILKTGGLERNALLFYLKNFCKKMPKHDLKNYFEIKKSEIFYLYKISSPYENKILTEKPQHRKEGTIQCSKCGCFTDYFILLPVEKNKYGCYEIAENDYLRKELLASKNYNDCLFYLQNKIPDTEENGLARALIKLISSETDHTYILWSIKENLFETKKDSRGHELYGETQFIFSEEFLEKDLYANGTKNEKLLKKKKIKICEECNNFLYFK
jgi:hypothetical protein